MPRRPTRGRPTRPTRREIKQRAQSTASTDDETDGRQIVRIEETGELRRIPSGGVNDLAALLTD